MLLWWQSHRLHMLSLHIIETSYYNKLDSIINIPVVLCVYLFKQIYWQIIYKYLHWLSLVFHEWWITSKQSYAYLVIFFQTNFNCYIFYKYSLHNEGTWGEDVRAGGSSGKNCSGRYTKEMNCRITVQRIRKTHAVI